MTVARRKRPGTMVLVCATLMLMLGSVGATTLSTNFCWAILTKESIKLSGGVVVDSFNSGSSAYSNNGLYDRARRRDGGNIGSVADTVAEITETGAASVYGRAATGPLGLISVKGNASIGSLAWIDGGNRGIQPGWYSNDLEIDIPDPLLPNVSFDWLPNNSGVVGGTNYDYVLPSGNYKMYQDFALSSSRKMVIEGHVILYFKRDFNITGSALVYVTPGSTLEIYLGGSASLSGKGVINGNGLASMCRIYGLSSCATIEYSGNSSFIGTIYAPRSYVKLSGGGATNLNFVGALVAKSALVTGKYEFHYDESLCSEGNLPPTANNDSYQTLMDLPLAISAPGVLLNDLDPDGDSLAAIMGTVPEHGTASFNADGSFNYVPTAGYLGQDQFTYRASDGTHISNPATVTIMVAAVPDIVALPDAYETPEDTLLTVSSPGVLGNDSGGTGGPLSAVALSQPQHGTLDLMADGSLTYLPVTNYYGPDSFSYRAGDGGKTSDPALVTILVTPVNDDPPLSQPDSYSTPEDVPLVVDAPGVLINDSDPDGDPMTASSAGQPQHGTLNLMPDGSFVYTPSSNYDGPDGFSYLASDGTHTSVLTAVTIAVIPANDPPVAQPNNYSTAEDVPLVIDAPGVLINDNDPDGDALTAGVASQPQHGTLNLMTDGSFTYEPAANFSGADSFTYRATDGLLTSTPALVAIQVTPANDPPVVLADSYTTTEDTLLSVTAPGLLANDTDPDGDNLTAAVETQPQHGSVSLNSNGSFNYMPAENFSGTDTFSYRANDGTALSVPAAVTVVVTPVNDLPIANPDNFITAEDTPLNVTVPGVLANDSDADGDPLTAVAATQPPHGTVVLNVNGSFSYQPATGFNGMDSFTYRASDGTSPSASTLVTVQVTPVADPPIANPDDYTTPEDVPLVIDAPGVLLNDMDEDGDPLTAVVESQPQHGSVTLNANGSFTYEAAAGYNGTDRFDYRANDGTSSSVPAFVTIQVTPVADPPVAVPDNYTTDEDVTLVVAAPGLLANDTDQDGDALTAVLSAPPTHGDVGLNLDGSFNYTPDAGYNGADSFTYRAYDGTTLSAQALVTVTIAPVGDQLIARPDNYTTAEDTPLNVAAPGVLANDSNQDGGALSAVLEDLPGHGTVSLFADGHFSYLPAANYNGPDAFSYRATDGVVSSSPVLVSIDVTPVSDPPVAETDMYLTPLNTTLVIGVPGVLGNDGDPDGDPLSAQLASPPAHGSVNLLANGSFTYIPATDYSGPDGFTYRASDGLLTSSATTVSIGVGTPGSNPGSVADSYQTLEDKALVIDAPGVLLNDAVDFGPNLVASLVGQPQHGSVSLSADGSFTYAPAADYFGTDSFQYRASDGIVSVGPVLVSLNILSVNDAPVFVGGPDQLVQQDAGAVTVAGWATNISPGPANESSQTVGFNVSADNNALFSSPPAITADGTLTYTPADGAYGVARVTARVQDSGGTANGGLNTSDPVELKIRVNSPPLVQVTSPEDGNIYFPHQEIPFVAAASDPDGIVTNATLLVDGLPVANFFTAPYSKAVSNLTSAAHVLTASAKDDLGATGNSAPVGLTVIPRPPVTPLGQAFNFQVDLVEQTIRVDNPTPYSITAVRVLVSNLPTGVRVFNASGTNQAGVAYALYNREIPARSSVLLTIEYLTPLVQTIQSTLVGEIVPLEPPPPAAIGELVTIKRMSHFPDGRILLTFDSIMGRVYFIEYSEDLVTWKTAFPSLTAVGEGIQWVDNGWPKTEGHPATVNERFYRVRVAPVPATP